jgi:hypothetical protein
VFLCLLEQCLSEDAHSIFFAFEMLLNALMMYRYPQMDDLESLMKSDYTYG